MQGSVRMSYGRNPPFIAPPDREETEREQSNHETAGCPGHGPASTQNKFCEIVFAGFSKEEMEKLQQFTEQVNRNIKEYTNS